MQPEFVTMFLSEVKEELKEKGLKQYKFSQSIGLNKATFSKFMRGEATPSLKTVKKIADKLDMRPILCLGDVDE